MEDSLLLHMCIQLNKMTDCSRLLSKMELIFPFIKVSVIFKTAKIHLTHLNKCVFVKFGRYREGFRKLWCVTPVLQELVLHLQRNEIQKVKKKANKIQPETLRLGTV